MRFEGGTLKAAEDLCKPTSNVVPFQASPRRELSAKVIERVCGGRRWDLDARRQVEIRGRDVPGVLCRPDLERGAFVGRNLHAQAGKVWSSSCCALAMVSATNIRSSAKASEEMDWHSLIGYPFISSSCSRRGSMMVLKI